MNNNFKIIRTIFENVYQRVLECKADDTGEIFYQNIITSNNIINLINIEELKRISSNILECINTIDRMYIYTKPLITDYLGLREYINNNKLTLKQQFLLVENIIILAQNIYNMKDIVQQKILDLDKIFIDKENSIIVDCNLIFEQEYDIADNETFKRLGNIIHFIFSGSEIVDYNISDEIPPDILKIIVRCLTREYLYPREVLAELKKSPIYTMIFGVEAKENTSFEKENKKVDDEIKVSVPFEDSYEDIEEDGPILDIYLKDNNISPKKNKKAHKKDIFKVLISIVIVVIVLLFGNKIIKMYTDSETVNKDIPANNGNENDKVPPINGENKEGEVIQPEISDSTEMYLNDRLINEIGYTGNKAVIDNEIYVDGSNSLRISNENDGKIKSLFAIVNFRDDNFNYLLKKQIGIAAKMKSESDVTAQVILEAYKDGELTSNFHTKTDIFNDMWSQFTVPINVTDADTLNVYLEFEGKNKVWIDSIYIDVMK